MAESDEADKECYGGHAAEAAQHGHTCLTQSCDRPAKLQCPTCLKLDIDNSWFCSQECFKSFWPEHKKVHQAKKLVNEVQTTYNSLPSWANQYKFTGTVSPGAVTARRSVPAAIERPDYAYHPTGVSLGEREARGKPVKVLDDDEVAAMRLVTRLARECLDEAGAACDAGVTTDQLDCIVHEAAVERECYPSPLGYYGFPKSCCTSVNEVICHGIPDTRPLQDGDICNVDVTVYHRGFHGDLNETFLVGEAVDEHSVRLVKTAHECMYNAIDIVRPGVKFRDIGNVIQKHAQTAGCSVVRTYCGHGIHRLFHTAPNVPHYAMSYVEMAGLTLLDCLGLDQNKAMGVMKAGNVFTIEPMINAGNWHDTKWPDEWTAVTTDGKRSAQFEQTLLVTDTGCEILTGRRQHGGRPWFVDQAVAHGYGDTATQLAVGTDNVRRAN